MRMIGLNYLGTWNRRVPREVVDLSQFYSLRNGVRIKFVRRVTWNETLLSKLFNTCHLPDYSAELMGFDNCPMQVGYSYHGCWLGDRKRIAAKLEKPAHMETNNELYSEESESGTKYVRKEDLPENIRCGN